MKYEPYTLFYMDMCYFLENIETKELSEIVAIRMKLYLLIHIFVLETDIGVLENMLGMAFFSIIKICDRGFLRDDTWDLLDECGLLPEYKVIFISTKYNFCVLIEVMVDFGVIPLF